jgi:hypothetical protein
MRFLEKLFSKDKSSQYEGENAALVQAMHAVGLADNDENRKKMYEILLASTLLTPTPEIPTASVSNDHQGRISLQLHGITDKQGRKLTPAFTDVEALRNWDPNTPCLSAQARGLFEFISENMPGMGVVINPFDPIRKMIRPMLIITRGECEVLGRGLVPRTLPSGLVGCQLPAAGSGESIQPPNQTLPPPVEEELRRSAESVPEIATLYVFSFAHTHGSPQLTVGLGLDKNVAKERVQLIVQTLWSAVAPRLGEIKTLDFMVTTGQIAAQVETAGNKIYQRL